MHQMSDTGLVHRLDRVQGLPLPPSQACQIQPPRAAQVLDLAGGGTHRPLPRSRCRCHCGWCGTALHCSALGPVLHATPASGRLQQVLQALHRLARRRGVGRDPKSALHTCYLQPRSLTPGRAGRPVRPARGPPGAARCARGFRPAARAAGRGGAAVTSAPRGGRSCATGERLRGAGPAVTWFRGGGVTCFRGGADLGWSPQLLTGLGRGTSSPLGKGAASQWGACDACALRGQSGRAGRGVGSAGLGPGRGWRWGLRGPGCTPRAPGASGCAAPAHRHFAAFPCPPGLFLSARVAGCTRAIRIVP